MPNKYSVRIAATIAVSFAIAACGGSQATSVSGGAESAAVSSSSSGLLTQGVQRFTVNGVDVILKQTVGNPIVRIGFYFDVGSADWRIDYGASALALAFSAMSDGGPADMERDTYLARLEAMGSSIGGAPGYDYTSVSMESVAPFWEETWELFAATLRNPALRELELERTRERQLAAIRSRFDDPDSAVVELVREGVFAGHVYAADPDGTEAGLMVATASDARAAVESLLSARDRITVVAVGNVSHEALVAKLADMFPDGEVAETTARPEVAPIVREAGSVAFLERAGQPTNYILGYFAAPDVTHPDYPALEVALSILDHRLFEEVRTERNLSYAVSAGLGSRRANSGYLYVTAADPNTTLQVMFDTVDAMINTPVSEQDLADQIEAYLTGYYIALQSNSAQASLLASWEITGGGMEAADAHIERLRAVTPAQVSEVLNRYVRNIHFGVVGDPAAIDQALFTSR